jgi:hypothetical protein
MVHYRQQALQVGSPSSSERSARHSQLLPGHRSISRFQIRNPQQPLTHQSRLRVTEEVSHTQSSRSLLSSHDGFRGRLDDSNAHDSAPRQSYGHRPNYNHLFTVNDDPFSPTLMGEQVTGSRSSAVSQASESIRSFNRSMNGNRVSTLEPSIAGSEWTRTVIHDGQLVSDLRGLQGSKNPPAY